MFTPQSAPRHRSAVRASYASSPLPRSPLVQTWRGTPTSQISSRASTQAASRADPYAVEPSNRYDVKLLRTSLPTSVTELATSVDPASAHLHNSGWAWLVTRQHQLVLWRYDDVITTTATNRQNVRAPRAVNLPPCPQPYTPAQVCVFSRSAGSGEDVWAVVSVSSHGHIRCWPQWPKSSSCSDIQIELPAGHNCVAIADCMPHGCVVATQQGDLFLLSMALESPAVSSSSQLTWRVLHSRNGVLAGLRRRVSSLFFTSTGAEQQFNVVALASGSDGWPGDDFNADRDVFVLSSSSVERWLMSATGDKMVASVDFNSMLVKQALAEQLCEADPELHVSYDGLHVSARDIRMEGSVAFILVSMTDHSTAASSAKPEQLFLLGLSVTPELEEQVLFVRKVPVSGLDSVHTLSWAPRLLQVSSSTNVEVAVASAYNDRHSESTGSGSKKVLAIQALFDRDQLGEPDNKLLVLLIKRDFIPPVSSLTRARTVAESSSGISSASTSAMTQRTSTDGGLASSASALSQRTTVDGGGGGLGRSQLVAGGGSDRYLQLRSTFLSFCQSENQGQCLSQCQQMFPTIDTDLDQCLAQLSRELINDRGVTDPRWAEQRAMAADPLSTAALLSAQRDLQNKQDVHDMFLQFVISMQWWDKLGLVSTGDQYIPTELLLGEHSEKLAAGSALVSLHCKHPSVLDPAVEHTLAHRHDPSAAAPTSPHHRFYHQVDGICDVVSSLVSCLEQQLSPAISAHSEQETELFLTTNSIVEAFLSAASQRRQKTYAIVFTPSVLQRSAAMEYLPWTASSGASGIRPALLRQFMLIAERALPGASNPAAQQQFFTQLGRLADNILDGYQVQLQSAKSINVDPARLEELQADMERTRRQVIEPFISHNQRETARQLAERYGDFSALISLAESVEDDTDGQLMKYMCRFAEEGFAEYVFKYYLDQGKLARLLSQPPALHQKLTEFLVPHFKLRWLHCLTQGDFQTANETLHDLAEEENVYLSKKKTLLSLAKLSYLAADSSEGDAIVVQPSDQYFSALCREQELIRMQEDLPQHITDGLELDFATMRPLHPVEMIEALIGTENDSVAPEDFLQALKILQLTNPSAEDTTVQACRIWSHAIVKEQAYWQSVEETERQDSVASTLLCRAIRLVTQDGRLPMSEYLPDPSVLLHSALLADLKLHTRPAVCFWLQAAYDHVYTEQQQQQRQQQQHEEMAAAADDSSVMDGF